MDFFEWLADELAKTDDEYIEIGNPVLDFESSKDIRSTKKIKTAKTKGQSTVSKQKRV